MLEADGLYASLSDADATADDDLPHRRARARRAPPAATSPISRRPARGSRRSPSRWAARRGPGRGRRPSRPAAGLQRADRDRAGEQPPGLARRRRLSAAGLGAHARARSCRRPAGCTRSRRGGSAPTSARPARQRRLIVAVAGRGRAVLAAPRAARNRSPSVHARARLQRPARWRTVLVVVVLGVWVARRNASAQDALATAQRDGSDSVQVLSAARILALRAQADESLALVARGGGDQDQRLRQRDAASSPGRAGGLLGDASRARPRGRARRRGVDRLRRDPRRLWARRTAAWSARSGRQPLRRCGTGSSREARPMLPTRLNRDSGALIADGPGTLRASARRRDGRRSAGSPLGHPAPARDRRAGRRRPPSSDRTSTDDPHGPARHRSSRSLPRPRSPAADRRRATRCTRSLAALATPPPTAASKPDAIAAVHARTRPRACARPAARPDAAGQLHGGDPPPRRARRRRRSEHAAASATSTRRRRRIEGFEIDLLREVARAIFGDPDKIEFTALTTAQRSPPCRPGRSTSSPTP